jgi:hypothetical protein
MQKMHRQADRKSRRRDDALDYCCLPNGPFEAVKATSKEVLESPITDILYSAETKPYTHVLPDSDTKAEAILHPPTPVDPRAPALSLLPRVALVDRLMALDPTLTNRKILNHLQRPKLARMLIRAMDGKPAVETRA